jgi:hypothetical protein
MSSQLEDWQRRALLTEYQVCQEDNSANFQGFWTLAAIFIGLSSAFLAGLIYAVIANKSLLSILLYHNEPQRTHVIVGIALAISIANVVILKNLKGWHRRIMFNQGVNLGRMREIELDLDLEMYRGWQIRAIDIWYDILKSDKRKQMTCDDQKWDKLKKKLEEGLDEKRHGKLDKRKGEILGLLDRYFSEEGKVSARYGKYELSSSRRHFPRILCTLMSLWVLVIVSALLASISVWSMLAGGLVAIVVLIAYAAVVVCCLKRSKV